MFSIWDERLRPLCPDGTAVLEPGGHLNAEALLNGVLYTEDGTPVPMRPGEYTAVVEFGWKGVDPPDAAWQNRQARSVFRWPLDESTPLQGD